MYRKRDLKRARKEYDRLMRRLGEGDGPPSRKLARKLDAAAKTVFVIERDLKRRGKLEVSRLERLQLALDDKYPKAKHGDIGRYKGDKYQIIYRPRASAKSQKSRSSWDHAWVPYKVRR